MKSRFLIALGLSLCCLGLAASAQAEERVEMITSEGRIVLSLNDAKAPVSTKNFLEYVRAGFYDGTVFHRVIAGFMIQGGGFTDDLEQKTTRDPIRNEAKNGLKNKVGTIAMARASDPHSASSQFFINVENNDFLDHPGQDGWGYAVFGKVVEGMDVVNKIAGVRTGRRAGMDDVPLEAVVIKKVQVLEKPKAQGDAAAAKAQEPAKTQEPAKAAAADKSSQTKKAATTSKKTSTTSKSSKTSKTKKSSKKTSKSKSTAKNKKKTTKK
ncbi:MAG: peptidyl-prolyl cis-trans isomerase [Rhodocyclaceae bacterium]|nr:peptidyl-prolyl cis-trans isomerase [Rhodocyclaceae bacterium]